MKDKKVIALYINIVISVISLGFNIYYSQKSYGLEKEKAQLSKKLENAKNSQSKYKLIFQDDAQEMQTDLDDLSHDVSDVEMLETDTSNLKNHNQVTILEKRYSKIYNNYWRHIDKQNAYAKEINSDLNFFLNRIDNDINSYKEDTTNSNLGCLPETGSLPDLEKLFSKYKKEEHKLIQHFKETKIQSN